MSKKRKLKKTFEPGKYSDLTQRMEKTGTIQDGDGVRETQADIFSTLPGGSQSKSNRLATEMSASQTYTPLPNTSFEQAQRQGLYNSLLDYQERLHKRAEKNRQEQAQAARGPLEKLQEEDRESLSRLYSLQNQLNTYRTAAQTNPQTSMNPMAQPQDPYQASIQQEYNTLYSKLNKKGYDVTELMRYYEREQNAKTAEETKKWMEEKAEDHPALMSAASVGLNLLTMQNSLPQAVKDAIYDKVYGTDLGVDVNAPAFFGTNARDAVRGQVSEDIVEKTREKYGDGAAWAANLLYNTGMSMADTLAANAIGGFTPVGSVIQGVNAANSSLVDATKRGVSSGKALLTAIGSGALEGVFEAVSLGKLKAMKPETSGTLKAIGKNVLKQMGVEASEEGATELANLALDRLINGDKSSLKQAEAAYIAQGMSEKEAQAQAVFDVFRQAGEAALGGALSGAGFGAGASLMNHVDYRNQLQEAGKKSLENGDFSRGLENALHMKEDSTARMAAEELMGKKTVTHEDIGRFMKQYERGALDELGRAGNLEELSQARDRLAREGKYSPEAVERAYESRIREMLGVEEEPAGQEHMLQEEDSRRKDMEAAEEAALPDQREVVPWDQLLQQQEAGKEEMAPGRLREAEKKERTPGMETADAMLPDEQLARRQEAEAAGVGAEPLAQEAKADPIVDAALYRAGLEQERAREAQESLPAAVHRETGQAMEAPVIESSGGPEGMRLRLPDGGTAGLSELEFARPETRTLYRMAESYPTEKARSYVGLYDGETPLRAYTEAFQRMYEAGERGSGYEAAAGRAEEVEGAQAIDPKRLKWMYEAGENRAKQRKMEETGKSGGDARQRRENGIAERAERGYNEKNSKAKFDYLDKQLGSLKGKVQINQYNSAESVNKWWVEHDYDKPPYTPKTVVQDITLKNDLTFVRVYDGENSTLKGGWVMRAEDIKGLTPAQIQEKFALPSTPKYVGEVHLKNETTIRMGEVNPNYGFKGGGIQFDLKGQRVGEFKEIGNLEDWSLGK